MDQQEKATNRKNNGNERERVFEIAHNRGINGIKESNALRKEGPDREHEKNGNASKNINMFRFRLNHTF